MRIRVATTSLGLAACSASPRSTPPVSNQRPDPTAAVADDAAPATAGDDADCTLQLEAIEGKLDHRAAGVTSLVAPARRERRVTEAIELADGTRVDFSLGGCAHYGWQLTYTVPAARLPAAPEQRLDATVALLGRTPIADALAKDMASAITKRPRTGAPRSAAGPWSIECGDATCDVEVTTDARTARIVVSYDFPL